MNDRDVDPKVKRLFPWALFLVLAALLALAAMHERVEGKPIPVRAARYVP